ncbi:methyltransferase [Mycobacterium phage Cosmo]|uniref:Methyltransferase n=1 Tax=Mycobacterium phage Cosmo TaxID=1567467 RepID=A0A0B4ZZS0_9CAUD|nr:methyltransferase [Mycobacterium phage Cosmo]
MNLPELADVCGTDKGAHQGFMPWYERYLPGPDKLVVMVELGVYKGESMLMWRNYFRHDLSWIVGVDIDLSNIEVGTVIPIGPKVWLDLGDHRGVWLHEGDQVASAETFGSFGFDLVVDDASHISSKTIASFDAWWPLVKPGGLYVVEDTHCSYDVDYYGMASAAEPERDCYLSGLGASRPKTTMAFLKRLADDVNWNIHGYDRFQPLYTDIAFVHFYPGICFIGKKS